MESIHARERKRKAARERCAHVCQRGSLCDMSWARSELKHTTHTDRFVYGFKLCPSPSLPAPHAVVRVSAKMISKYVSIREPFATAIHVYTQARSDNEDTQDVKDIVQTYIVETYSIVRHAVFTNTCTATARTDMTDAKRRHTTKRDWVEQRSRRKHWSTITPNYFCWQLE